MDLNYKETEPFENGFADHFLKNIAPLLNEIEIKRSEAEKNFTFAPLHDYEGRLKRLVLPEILSFFGPYTFSGEGSIETSVLGSGLFPGWIIARQHDQISGAHKGRPFEFANVRLEGGRDHTSRNKIEFDGAVLRIEIPPVPGITMAVNDQGRVGNWFEGIGKAFRGVLRVPLDNDALEAEFEVYASDAEVAKNIVGEDLIDMKTALSALFGSLAPDIAFHDRSFVVKIETSGKFLELNQPAPSSFGVPIVKKFVRDIYNLLQIIDIACGVADRLEDKFIGLTQPAYVDQIVDNGDGTFTVQGRSYKSRSSAEAFLDHFG